MTANVHGNAMRLSLSAVLFAVLPGGLLAPVAAQDHFSRGFMIDDEGEVFADVRAAAPDATGAWRNAKLWRSACRWTGTYSQHLQLVRARPSANTIGSGSLSKVSIDSPSTRSRVERLRRRPATIDVETFSVFNPGQSSD